MLTDIVADYNGMPFLLWFVDSLCGSPQRCAFGYARACLPGARATTKQRPWHCGAGTTITAVLRWIMPAARRSRFHQLRAGGVISPYLVGYQTYHGLRLQRRDSDTCARRGTNTYPSSSCNNKHTLTCSSGSDMMLMTQRWPCGRQEGHLPFNSLVMKEGRRLLHVCIVALPFSSRATSRGAVLDMCVSCCMLVAYVALRFRAARVRAGMAVAISSYSVAAARVRGVAGYVAACLPYHR